MTTGFDDLLAANEEYAARFDAAEVPGKAARGLAVVTCMDSRIDPLAVLGLSVGDVKVLRNPGGQVTDDVLRALVLADAPARRRPGARRSSTPSAAWPR